MQRLFLVVLLTSVACSDDDDSASAEQPTSGDPNAASITTIGVEIDYVTGAAPYTGAAGRLADVWELSQVNLDRVFQGRTVLLPHVIADMQELTDVDGQDFAVDDILAIADRHRDTWLPSSTTAAYYGLWLDGYFSQDGQRQTAVLGVALGDTGVLAMFKPVIDSTSSAAFPNIVRFVEQTTFIHEMGHAAGLVNNGVAMTSQHEDTEHAGHCTHQDCVMYYLNEGAADIVDYAATYASTGSSVLFDPECLADLDAARQQ